VEKFQAKLEASSKIVGTRVSKKEKLSAKTAKRAAKRVEKE